MDMVLAIFPRWICIGPLDDLYSRAAPWRKAVSIAKPTHLSLVGVFCVSSQLDDDSNSSGRAKRTEAFWNQDLEHDRSA